MHDPFPPRKLCKLENVVGASLSKLIQNIMSLMSDVIQSSSYMHIHNFTRGWLLATDIQWVKDILTWNAVSLPCTQSSSKAGTLVCWGSGCPSACLLCRLAFWLQASLACLASACSIALCSRLRSHSFSSLECWLASGPVPLLCVCGHAHVAFLPFFTLLRCSAFVIAHALSI